MKYTEEELKLRDQFAMAALSNLAGIKSGTYIEFAKDCYGYADAMMEARKIEE